MTASLILAFLEIVSVRKVTAGMISVRKLAESLIWRHQASEVW